MLDSSPVALPTRRPLKRSASTASLASLPTPPRTHRKHARGRSRGSCDSDSDDNAVLSTDDEAPDAHKSKKRRTSEVANDEEAFWLGGPATEDSNVESSNEKDQGLSKTASTSVKNKAPLLYRRLQQTEVAPVSPPPSHRRPAVVASVKPESVSGASVSPPSTPQTRSATRRAALALGSPENPFLATPVKDIVEESTTPSPSGSSANPSPHTPVQYEKPMMTFVFRGVRREYANPLYNHAENKPLPPPAASLLPIEHPDYSPPVHCTPKLLFPAARRNLRGKNAAPKSRARSPSLSGDELNGADIKPKKLDFGKAANSGKSTKPKQAKKDKAQTQTLDQELKTAGEEVFL
ncbi:hypothetical protein BDN70DRAFT_806253 [Pholiota conissans]|uniref:Uncharacterized protein n=1 Tax=Pholiota conissans TaxID=109636 RepID=A0A9P5Z4F6_9AGAR|nr:hypothetical protein BDN70DRAFT_806253 [Pholiota conissans]